MSTTAAAPPAVSTRGLTKQYGSHRAVDGLDLTVQPGEIFGLLGPNGAGKTTTILMLLGLTVPTAGEVRVLGLDPAVEPLAVKQRVGYLPDDVGFYPERTGRQNLRFTAELNGLDPEWAESHIDGLLTEVGLADDADRPAGEYSRGMRQRLGLADALVKSPDLLILDEPTVNIDPEGVREILGLVHDLSRQAGITVLLSSHLLHQVEQVCDRIGIFVDGRLVTVGTVDELRAEGSGGQWRVDLDTDEPLPRIIELAGARLVDDERRPVLVEADDGFPARLLDVCRTEPVVVTHLRRVEVDLDEVYHRYFGEGVPA